MLAPSPAAFSTSTQNGSSIRGGNGKGTVKVGEICRCCQWMLLDCDRYAKGALPSILSHYPIAIIWRGRQSNCHTSMTNDLLQPVFRSISSSTGPTTAVPVPLWVTNEIVASELDRAGYEIVCSSILTQIWRAVAYAFHTVEHHEATYRRMRFIKYGI